MPVSELQKKIENHSANLAVIGLGYVGLPVAALFAQRGFNVTGRGRQSRARGEDQPGHFPNRG